MVKISKDEAKRLRQMGVKDKEGGISTTHSHNRESYLCEKPKNMELLKQIRKD